MKRFYKDTDGRWYFDMPKADEIGVFKEDLEMILGANNMLDDLAQGKDEISLYITPISNSAILSNVDYISLIKLEESSTNNGCYYVISKNKHTNISLIWLCSVTTIVYGYFPDHLVIQIK